VRAISKRELRDRSVVRAISKRELRDQSVVRAISKRELRVASIVRAIAACAHGESNLTVDLFALEAAYMLEKGRAAFAGS
jgi:hypothetical protein